MRPRALIRTRTVANRLALVFLAILGALGASDPEVVQVRASAAKVSAWFPAGSDIEVLAPRDFDELLRSVRIDQRQFKPRESSEPGIRLDSIRAS